MQMSRTMVIGWMTLALSVLAVPQVVALVPEGATPYVAMAAGVLTLTIRWLNGQMGVEPLTLLGVAQLVGGLLAVPVLLGLIPENVMPILTAISAVLTLVARYQSGENPLSEDSKTGLLFRKA